MELNPGDKFGLWTLLERDPNIKGRDKRWFCRCECGTIKSVLQKYLANGKSTSCGCSKKKDLAGERFGNLTVLETIYGYNGSNRATHKCLCDCGNITYVSNTSISKTSSCGECNQRALKEIGNTYGRLTIVDIIQRPGATYCVCNCECGTTGYITRLTSLRTGNTSSCGCIHSPDLTGMKFGRLEVISEAPSNTHQRMWECECDCGNPSSVFVKSYQLTSGHTKSCGCLRSESVSQGEILIADILNDIDVTYEKEKTFNDCKGVGGKSLRYDFYLPKYNTCIEYNGEQHYTPVKYFGGEVAFKRRTANDELKNEYCLEHNIHLEIIPHTKTDKEIREIINNIIQNPVTTTV